MATQKQQKRSSADIANPETIKNNDNDTLAHAINKAPNKMAAWTKMYLIWLDMVGQSMER